LLQVGLTGKLRMVGCCHDAVVSQSVCEEVYCGAQGRYKV